MSGNVTFRLKRLEVNSNYMPSNNRALKKDDQNIFMFCNRTVGQSSITAIFDSFSIFPCYHLRFLSIP